jgi:hypothetical protein
LLDEDVDFDSQELPEESKERVEIRPPRSSSPSAAFAQAAKKRQREDEEYN